MVDSDESESMRRVSSALPETAIGRPPTSPTATEVTASVCPVRGAPTGAPVVRSQTRTVWWRTAGNNHQQPVRTADSHCVHLSWKPPSQQRSRPGARGEVPDAQGFVGAAQNGDRGPPPTSPTATEVTQSVCPVRGAPTGYRLRSQMRRVSSALPETAIGRPPHFADRHRGNPVSVPGKGSADRSTRGEVPDAQGFVGAARDGEGRPPTSPTATEVTQSVCPVRGAPTGAPVARSRPERSGPNCRKRPPAAHLLLRWPPSVHDLRAR